MEAEGSAEPEGTISDKMNSEDFYAKAISYWEVRVTRESHLFNLTRAYRLLLME